MSISFRRGYFGNSSSSATTITRTYLAGNDLGSLLIASVTFEDLPGTTTVTGISDGAGNTWQIAGAKAISSGDDAIYTYYAWGSKLSASNTVQFTLSASAAFRQINITEWRSTHGPWTSVPLDKTDDATGSSTSLDSGPVTPASDGQLIYGWGVTFSGSLTAGAGFSMAGGGPSGAGAVYRTQVAAASTATTMVSSVSEPWAMSVATFADAAVTVVSGAEAAQQTLSVASSTGRGRALMSGG